MNPERAAKLRAAIRDLPDAQNRALTLHYLQQEPLDTVARRLRISENDARALVQQAIEALRAKMKA